MEKLKAYANENGIEIIGDIPIYCALDSADVWCEPELFQLDKDRVPTVVAGFPPDAFSADGQLWGNPIYNWDRMKQDNYRWWAGRMRFAKQLYDIVRIDHFIGFNSYYAIPFGSKTAHGGEWREGPKYDLFKVIKQETGNGGIKTTVLKEWYELYPERFQNKTNGITQRRWLALCNRELSGLITELLGDNGWMTDLSRLAELKKYADDENVLNRFISIKQEKKRQLADYIKKSEGIKINPNSIYDIQIKRLHEYKRQLLNAFSVLYLYYEIKDGNIKDFTPTTFIFGAKAAPGYYRAKGIIKYINEIAKLVNSDPATRDLLQVVFVSNYRVTYAEKLVAAADISEQISTAGTEASGTRNMKLMLNGAVTLGTLDGANVEIAEEAGAENEYIFGATVEELNGIMPNYVPRDITESDPKIKRIVSSLIDGTVSDGGSGVFRELYFALMEGASWHAPDHYYLLGDLDSYVKAKLDSNRDYRDKTAFAKKCWLNMCSAGKFSSDRTIAEYARDIWHIDSISL